MGEDVPPAVEFLGGASDAGPEEILAERPPSSGRTGPLLLIGALLLVAVLGAAIARGRTGGAPHRAPVAASDPATAVVSGPVPVAAGAAGAGSSALTDCPARAQCSVWARAPAAALAALRAAFPHAVVQTATTVLANRAGHFEPDLLRRVVVAQDGARTIRIGIRPASPPPSVAGGERPATGPRIEVRAHRYGYRICVAVSGAGAGEVSPRAALLAADARLLAPL